MGRRHALPKPKSKNRQTEAAQSTVCKSSTSPKWRSLVTRIIPCLLAAAAIQMSLSGMGRPFTFNCCFKRPYSRATSRPHVTIALPEANCSIFAKFSIGRPDLAAPKNNSPSAVAGTNTSVARSRFDKVRCSPSSKAMMIFVSSRNLPLGGVNLLTLFLDRLSHLPSRCRVDTAGESAQIRTLLSRCCRTCERNHETQHLFLHCRRQLLNLLRNLLRYVHCVKPLLLEYTRT